MNENQKNYLIAALLLAVCVLGWVLFSNISDIGKRDADIRKQFQTLERNQHDLTTRLDGITKDLATSQRRIETISSRIANAEAGVSEVAGQLADSQKSLTESAGLIDSNERILQGIRKRAEATSK